MSTVLVTVHGAGKQPKNYFQEILDALAQRLGAPPTCVAVYYADITNLGAPLGIAPTSSATRKRGRKPKRKPTAKPTPTPESEQEHNFKMGFMMEVQRDLNALPQDPRTGVVKALGPIDVASLVATELNEIAGYLFRQDVFNAIQTRMMAGLTQAAANADNLVIASHSLGTVVAFDALRTTPNKFNITHWFTLGSPLAKLRRMNVRSDDVGKVGDCVAQWLNYYDTTDPVANALGPAFPRPGYRLYDVFVDVAQAPIPSHDYFRNNETLDAIAATLR